MVCSRFRLSIGRVKKVIQWLMCVITTLARSKAATWRSCGGLKTSKFPEDFCKAAKTAQTATDFALLHPPSFSHFAFRPPISVF
jgi:hypothetical protein